MSMAFEEIRVLDFSTRLSGAWAARLFGDFGAEVLMIESPSGHVLRDEPPFTSRGLSLLHAYANSNKQSIMADECDLAQLVRSADVIVTTAIDIPPDLQELAADQVHLSITPHGLTGPLADQPGNNLTACARVGWAAINACEDEAPLQLPNNQSGYIAGVAGFVAAAALLYRVNSTGFGDRADVSEIEALANTCAPWAQVGNFIGGSNRMAHGPNGPRRRDRPGPLWQTKNGAINFGYGDWAQWTSAFHFLGLREIAENPDFISPFGRHQKDTRPVRDGLAEVLPDWNKWDVFHGLAERRCISGVVQNAKELVESDHLNAREFLIDTQIDEGTFKSAGAFAKLSATPLSYRRPAPIQGEHSGKNLLRQRDSKAPKGQPTLPLNGIRVLTFTQAWSGTFGTQLLALLGADVVQIESRKRPDVWRGAGAPVPPAIRDPEIRQDPLNNNGMYNSVNLNKRAITLDLAQPEGKKLFWAMIPKFDILCDNFSPHVMTKWGVTLESLQQKRPDIIFASLSGYGRTGPLAEYPANGATTEPMAGLASIHGYEGDESQNTGGLIPDPISGFYFAASILAALNHRQKTAEGQRIDLSMIESVATHVGDAILEYGANSTIRQPRGNQHPKYAPHNVYLTKDNDWLVIAVEDNVTFTKLAALVGIHDEKFSSIESRKANEEELDNLIQQWTSSHPIRDLIPLLKNTGVINCKVRDFLGIYARPNAQFAHRKFMVPVTHPESGTHFMPTNPWIYEQTAQGEINPSPCFGQHSQAVLNEELGIDSASYAELETSGITGTTRIRS